MTAGTVDDPAYPQEAGDAEEMVCFQGAKKVQGRLIGRPNELF